MTDTVTLLEGPVARALGPSRSDSCICQDIYFCHGTTELDSTRYAAIHPTREPSSFGLTDRARLDGNVCTVDLWHGSLSDFVRRADAGSLPGDMTGQFVRLHRYPPNASEVRSWDQSLAALAAALRPLRNLELGVAVGASGATGRASLVRDAGNSPAAVALEYHLPLSGKRVDVVVTGHDTSRRASALVIELKQWSEVGLEDEFATNVLIGGNEHVHPSEQARDYADWLLDYHSSFTSGDLAAIPASYCHNLLPPNDEPLRDPRFADLLQRSPLFTSGEEHGFVEFVGTHVGAGDGVRLLERLTGARFQPSKRVLDTLEAVLDARDEWHLLDEQRLAYNAILDEVRRQQARAGRAAVLIRGAPGTGKTVVAVQLLAAALRLGWKAAHSTGGKAFTTALRSKFDGAHGLFLWNMSLRDAPPQALDLLLVDEAHRVRETSDIRFTPKGERGRRSQTEELISAAKVAVFLLDENQFVRPDEVGSSTLIRGEAKRKGARIKEFDLRAQFRCGGCVEYVTWVDWILGFAAERPESWGDRYRVEVVDTPEELEQLVQKASIAGETARVVAGFCWKWSDPPKTGDLVADVVIGNWRRPWNRKAGKRTYKPAEHPYTKWADTPEGESQIGCIYSAQGFEFGRIGVIWGKDLVWRDGRWMAQPVESRDSPVKSSPEMLTLVRNAYRVLLTRGLRGAKLLILDEETRAHVERNLGGMQAAS